MAKLPRSVTASDTKGKPELGAGRKKTLSSEVSEEKEKKKARPDPERSRKRNFAQLTPDEEKEKGSTPMRSIWGKGKDPFFLMGEGKVSLLTSPYERANLAQNDGERKGVPIRDRERSHVVRIVRMGKIERVRKDKNSRKMALLRRDQKRRKRKVLRTWSPLSNPRNCHGNRKKKERKIRGAVGSQRDMNVRTRPEGFRAASEEEDSKKKEMFRQIPGKKRRTSLSGSAEEEREAASERERGKKRPRSSCRPQQEVRSPSVGERGERYGILHEAQNVFPALLHSIGQLRGQKKKQQDSRRGRQEKRGEEDHFVIPKEMRGKPCICVAAGKGGPQSSRTSTTSRKKVRYNSKPERRVAVKRRRSHDAFRIVERKKGKTSQAGLGLHRDHARGRPSE